MAGHHIEYGIGKVAVGINKGKSTAGTYVVTDEFLEKRRLAHACLADDSQVSTPIIWPDAKCLAL